MGEHHRVWIVTRRFSSKGEVDAWLGEHVPAGELRKWAVTCIGDSRLDDTDPDVLVPTETVAETIARRDRANSLSVEEAMLRARKIIGGTDEA